MFYIENIEIKKDPKGFFDITQLPDRTGIAGSNQAYWLMQNL